MTIGLHEAARRAGRKIEIALAIDSDPEVVELYKSNLPKANARAGEVDRIFDGHIGAEPTPAERLIALEVGTAPDILVGGPPCQGHSDLNNRTRRRDPKNALYLLMARATEILKPRVVVIENVTGAQWDKDGVVQLTKDALLTAGYRVASKVLDLRIVGAPQRRRRFVMIGSRLEKVDPEALLDDLANSWGEHSDRTVRWAIEDLLHSSVDSVFESASAPTAKNLRRINFLFDNNLYNLPDTERPECHQDGEHSYVSVYGRLKWSEPAQTITTGFGCMGQGRYVHPKKRRTITPHEAARLQTFPDWFDFGAESRRGMLAKAIGNAVPPLLLVEIGRRIIPHLPQRNDGDG